MKRFFSLLLLSFLFLSLWTEEQVSFSMTKLIGNDTISMYFIIDDVEFKYVRLSEKKGNIYANGESIDSTGINLWTNQYSCLFYRNKVYFNTLYPYDSIKHFMQKKLVYSIADGKVTTFDYSFDYDMHMNPYKCEQRYAKVYRFNPETGKQTLFADLWNEVEKIEYIDGREGAEEDIEHIFFINENSAFISLCYSDGSSGDGCTSIKYFLVYGPNNQIEITKKISPKTEMGWKVKNYKSEIQFISNDNKYLKDNCWISTYNKNIRKGFDGYISRLFDVEFNYISNLLTMHNYTTSGINIQKGNIQNYFMRSIIDSRDSTNLIYGQYPHKSYIIPYKFNPTLELGMYKVYNNELLAMNDLKGLGKYELGILRNLIFAKHNYAFSSDFYQAYFNLYEFYGEEDKRKTRLKNIDHLLTEIDKANIKCIKGIETKE
jgi:hypothetical protein